MAKTRYIFSSRPQRHPVRTFFRTLLILLISAVLLVGMANFIVTHSVQLVRQSVTIQNLPEGLENFTIMVISDLNGETLGSHQKSILNAIGTTAVSCIVFTGDVCGPGGDVSAFLELVAGLPEDTSKYLVPGDMDPDLTVSTAHGSLSVLNDWAQQVQEAGVTILEEPVIETRNKASLYIVPASLYSLDLAAMESAYQARVDELDAKGNLTADESAVKRLCEYQLEKTQRIRETAASMTEDDVQIAVTHVPFTSEYIRSEQQNGATGILSLNNASLVIAGHYCGGQWRIPGIGALYVEELGWYPDDSEVQGLSYHRGLWQYISPGLTASLSSPLPGRLFCQPTVTILALTSRIT